jgi:hypothetical protein
MTPAERYGGGLLLVPWAACGAAGYGLQHRIGIQYGQHGHFECCSRSGRREPSAGSALMRAVCGWAGVMSPACCCAGRCSAPRGAVDPDGGERPSISLLSQQWGEAGGSLIRGSPGRAGAASTKSRRSGTAGRAGRGERDGKVYARNRLRYASLHRASSEPSGCGLVCGAYSPIITGGELRGGSYMPELEVAVNCLRRSRGDATGVEPGA